MKPPSPAPLTNPFESFVDLPARVSFLEKAFEALGIMPNGEVKTPVRQDKPDDLKSRAQILEALGIGRKTLWSYEKAGIVKNYGSTQMQALFSLNEVMLAPMRMRMQKQAEKESRPVTVKNRSKRLA